MFTKEDSKTNPGSQDDTEKMQYSTISEVPFQCILNNVMNTVQILYSMVMQGQCTARYEGHLSFDLTSASHLNGPAGKKHRGRVVPGKHLRTLRTGL